MSPTPLDLSAFDGKADFLTVANLQGWFAAITRSQDGNIREFCPILLILTRITGRRTLMLAVVAPTLDICHKTHRGSGRN